MDKVRIVIDRIESGIAICEQADNYEWHKFEISQLPEGAEEGDEMIYDGTQLILDKAATSERRKRIQGMLDQLFKR
ncbi:MAG: DUF3006 domain-containing protein [Defluviitaleaceae bacterium]|nr:DUF3006 domain-containing protein [Defluviitaleaceae bacterium]